MCTPPTIIPHQQPTTPTSHRPSDQLLRPDDVIRKYPKLVGSSSNIGRLAVRLAVQAYFGKKILKKCSVYGFSNRESLPKDKVFALKQKLLSLFPQYLSCPVDFEPLWTKSVTAINHCAAGLRAKEPIVIN